MSANEKKIADFILGNIDYLRDYSSQQVASAVGVSQSSIVKFSQKLGYKGYPDLKLAINESAAISRVDKPTVTGNISDKDSINTVFEKFNANITSVLTGTFDINNADKLEAAVQLIDSASTVLVISAGRCQSIADDFSSRLTELGKMSFTANHDKERASDLLQVMSKNDVMLVISEQATSQDVLQLSKLAHQRGVKVVALSKFGSNQLAAVAEVELYAISLNDEAQPLTGALLIRFAQQQVLDVLLIRLAQLPNFKNHIVNKG